MHLKPCKCSHENLSEAGTFIIYLFIYRCLEELGILVPRPGMEPVPPAVEAGSPSHWTTREFLKL